MKSNNAWIPELKENMRRTTNTVLEINKLLKEVRPLSEETPQCSKSDPLNDLDEDDPRYVFNTFFSSTIFFSIRITSINASVIEVMCTKLYRSVDIQEMAYHAGALEDNEEIRLSCLELRQSVADFLEICLQELHDLS